MMKSWSNTLFPLTILLVLAGLTFWLRHASRVDEPEHDRRLRHGPEYIITDGVLTKIDETGNLRYILKAIDIRHFPNDSITYLKEPRLIYMPPTKPIITTRAKRGQVSPGGERVDLYDDVQITRAATPDRPMMTASMSQLTVFPDEERGFTKSPVLITEGKSWLKGIGMQVNYVLQTYTLESNAVGSIESRHGRR